MFTRFFILLTTIFLSCSISKAQQLYSEEFEALDSLHANYLSKTLLQASKDLQKQIQTDPQNPYQEQLLFKAFLYELAASSEIQKDELEYTILTLLKRKGDFSAELQPLIQVMLAKFIIRYADRHTADEKFPANDFRSWEDSTALAKADSLFDLALKDKKILQKPISDYWLLLEDRQNYFLFNRYFPTLYDLVAMERLESFYGLDDSWDKQEFPDTLLARLLLAPTDEFVRFDSKFLLVPEQLRKWVAFFQDWLFFHQQLDHHEAELAADLIRYRKAESLLQTQSAINLLEQRLQALATRDSLEGRHRAAYYLADHYFDRSQQEEALQIEPQKRWKRSTALELCQSIIANCQQDSFALLSAIELQKKIQFKEIQTFTEAVVPIQQSSLCFMAYQNIAQLKLQLIPLNQQARIQLDTFSNGQDRFLCFNKKKSVWDSTLLLKDGRDLYAHSTEIALPALKAGYYLLLAYEKNTEQPDSIFHAWNTFQVSNIGIMQIEKENKQQFIAVHRQKGTILPDVEASFHKKKYNYKKNHSYYKAKKQRTANEQGEIRTHPIKKYKDWYPEFYWEKDSLFLSENFRNGSNYQRKYHKVKKAHLFTDRSIYRPGQAVHFKGIVVQSKNRNEYQVEDNCKLEVRFSKDHYGDAIDEKDVITNEFGSFSGTFKIPDDGYTGTYYIKTSDPSVYTQIEVEEYKRPEMQLTVDPVESVLIPGDSVLISGKASTVNGVAIPDASVTFYIQSIARYQDEFVKNEHFYNGNVQTDALGNFEISFKSLDLGADLDSNAYYLYRIAIEVTDLVGETKSRVKNMRIESTPFVFNFDGFAKEVDASKGLAGQPLALNEEQITQSTSGQVKIWRLRRPSVIYQERYWPLPEFPALDSAAFQARFPNMAYQDEHLSAHWPKAALVYQGTFSSDSLLELPASLTSNWPQGQYRLQLSSEARGHRVQGKHDFTLLQPQASEAPLPVALYLSEQERDKIAEVGDTALLKIGTAADSISLLLEIYHDDELLEYQMHSFSKGMQQIPIPIEQAHRGGLDWRISCIYNNRAYQKTGRIEVPFSDKDLKISYSSFRNRLLPGQQERWQIKIEGPDSEQVSAELCASLYDASLDQIISHDMDWSLYRSSRKRFNRPVIYLMGYSPEKFQFSSIDYLTYSYSYGYPEFNYYTLEFDGGWVYNYNTNFQHQDYYNHKQQIFLSTTPRKIYSQEKYTKDYSPNLLMKLPQKADAESSTVSYRTGVLTQTKKQASLYQSYNLRRLPFFIIRRGYNAYDQSYYKNEWDYNKASVRVDFSTNYLAKGVVVQDLNPYRGNVYAQMDREDDPIALRKVVIADDLRYKEMIRKSQNGLLSPTQQAEMERELSYLAFDENDYNRYAFNTLDFEEVKIRKNLDETVFFKPHLRTDSTGHTIIEFTMNEALTEWKLLLFAHTKDLKTASDERSIITQKQLMIKPATPRFLRQGDTLYLSARVSNLRDTIMPVQCKLVLRNALNEQEVGALFSIRNNTQKLSLKAQESELIRWKIIVPDTFSQPVLYQMLVVGEEFSDGEQNVLPVLSNRMLVNESMAMTIPPQSSKKWTLGGLKKLGSSSTLKAHRLTLEFTPNPSWYAIMSMPYLMKFPHECSEQLFSRFYANSLASHVLNSHPKIKAVFDAWASEQKPAINDQLTRNEELRYALLSETPWVLEQSPEQQLASLGQLFKLHKMQQQQRKALRKMLSRQVSYGKDKGGLRWFTGGDADRHITQHILTGIAHLKKLQVDLKMPYGQKQSIEKALQYSDRMLVDQLEDLMSRASQSADSLAYMQQNQLTALAIQYLYMRSFYEDKNDYGLTAHQYFLQQASQYWTAQNSHLRLMIGLALLRHPDYEQKGRTILQSFEENLIYEEARGAHLDYDYGWYWYQSPIETHALLMEAFTEIGAADSTLTALKTWLLQQKRTQHWGTTKTTTAACYALLMSGENWLLEEAPLQVQLGGQKLEMDSLPAQAGTGYVKMSWPGSELQPSMAEIQVSNPNKAPAWGAAHWQYFEQLDQIQSYADNPLQVHKQLFVRKLDAEGESWEKVTAQTKLQQGDLLKVRLRIVAKQAVEYIHLKDQRSAGFEPVSVLSEYKSQNGLSYYESSRDAATHFFFDRIPEGEYLLEYPLRANHLGQFSTGITTIQSMYSPELGSHSEGERVSIW